MQSLTPTEKQKLESDLKACDSVAQMFDVLDRTFDLAKCRPGAITKTTFITGMMKGVTMLNPSKK
jgi:hypothetical protein